MPATRYGYGKFYSLDISMPEQPIKPRDAGTQFVRPATADVKKPVKVSHLADSAKPSDAVEANRENHEKTVSEPDKFANDPNDPKNPNEAIERHRRKLRP